MKGNNKKIKRTHSGSFLPKNWCQLVRKALDSKGVTLTEKRISQLKSGYLKNLEHRKLVLLEIKKLQKDHKKRLNEVQKLAV